MAEVNPIVFQFRLAQSSAFGTSICDSGDEIDSSEWIRSRSSFSIDTAVEDEDFISDAGRGNGLAHASENDTRDDRCEEGTDAIDYRRRF